MRAAVVAYARHNYTDYDTNFSVGYDRDENRFEVKSEIREKLTAWEKELHA